MPARGAVLRGVREQAGVEESLNSDMTFKAIVQGGLIVVDTRGTVPDGTAVEVEIVRKRKPVATPSKVKGTGHTPGFGIWRNRPELDCEDPVRVLRAIIRRRRLA